MQAAYIYILFAIAKPIKRKRKSKGEKAIDKKISEDAIEGRGKV